MVGSHHLFGNSIWFKKIYNLTASLDFGRFWQCCRGIFLQAFRGTELHLGIVLHTWNNNGTVGFPVKKINWDLIKDQSQSWSDLTTYLRTIFFWNRSTFLLRNCSTLLLWVVTAFFSLNGLYDRSLKNHLKFCRIKTIWPYLLLSHT